MTESLPYFTEGEVVKGFGRGSKELGIPTANFPTDVVDRLPADIEGGVYCGWASVDNGPVYKMVLSIGWNPYYHNTKKSMETHIIHTFGQDFYGSNLKIVMLKYIRPMRDYKSLDELIAAIETDISDSEAALDQPENSIFKTDSFFTQNTKGSNSDCKGEKYFSDTISSDNLKSEAVKDSI